MSGNKKGKKASHIKKTQSANVNGRKKKANSKNQKDSQTKVKDKKVDQNDEIEE